MRKNRAAKQGGGITMMALDDDSIMTLTLQTYFSSSGYDIDIENDPLTAVERLREKRYDILLLDFLMSPICGDEVVARIREFDSDIYIILLTGHKSMAPPIDTIRNLNIQGYYEKSDRFDQLELLVESCVKSIKHMRVINNYRDNLGMLIDLDREIFEPQPMEELLFDALGGAARVFGLDEGFIYVQDEGTAADYYAGTGGFDMKKDAAVKMLREGTERFMPAGSEYYIEDGAITVPLYDERRKTAGIMRFTLKAEMKKDSERLFAIFVRQLRSAIDGTALSGALARKNAEIEKAYTMLNKNYIETVTLLRKMVDARDIYTRGHSDRVAYYAAETARALGMDESFIRRIRLGGLFHDVGKIGVPDNVLLKKGALTDEEYAVIKQHAQNGYDMLLSIGAFRDILGMVKSHHERYGGGGYPDGISGESIPLEARIVAVADAFDAMTSHRRYRVNLTLEEAIDQLEKGSGTQFDADIARVFIGIVRERDIIGETQGWEEEAERALSDLLEKIDDEKISVL